MFYNTWKYHASSAPRLITSQEELDSLNSEWADSPSAALEIARNAEPVVDTTSAPVDAPVAEVPPVINSTIVVDDPITLHDATELSGADLLKALTQ